MIKAKEFKRVVKGIELKAWVYNLMLGPGKRLDFGFFGIGS